MPLTVTEFRVFIASPAGLEIERRAFRQVLTDYSEEHRARRVLFSPIGWEITLGGVGRPQELINADLMTCDYFILVLWDRWGTPTGAVGEEKFSSGCEEEFALALRCLADPSKPMRGVVVLFKDVDEKRLHDPGSELQKVLTFRRGLEESKKHLFMTFSNTTMGCSENFSVARLPMA
jgi:hypothetical protein